jgi:cardiolipin synthase C
MRLRPPCEQRRAALAILLLLAALPAAAERVAVLHDARSAAEARVVAVLGAERELYVSTFIVGDEPFSLTALTLLRGAARRGLDVRLLVDAQWNKMPEAVEAHLLAEGVAVRRFHPFRLAHPLWVTKRLHDKLLIADGEVVVLGGRNVESPYFGFGDQLERRDYVDLDLRVEGAAAGEARRYFLEVWDSRHTAPSGARASAAELAAAAAELDRHAAWLAERVLRAVAERWVHPQGSPAGGAAGPAAAVGEVRFLHDPPGGKGSAPGVGRALLEVLAAARESVVLESAYLIPTRELRAGLAAAIARGVSVRILTNSLATTDNLWAQAGYAGKRRRLVRMGVELWEYSGPESIHTKAGVIDGRTVVVGSFNLDPRSARLNTEVAVVLESEPLAAEVRAFLDEHLERARRIDGRGWPEGADGPYPGVPRRKVCRLRLLRLLAPLIRSQL